MLYCQRLLLFSRPLLTEARPGRVVKAPVHEAERVSNSNWSRHRCYIHYDTDGSRAPSAGSAWQMDYRSSFGASVARKSLRSS